MTDHPRYELLDEIGRGPSAIVWRARDLAVGRQVAVKALHEAPSGDEVRRQLLDGAAELARLADHDHLVRVFDIDRERGWLVLEYLPDSLARRLADGPLPVDEVRAVLRQGLAGLDVLHTAGRLHGAVKPSNLLGEGGRIKLGDALGIDPAAGGEQLRPVGLPKYLAPEFIDPAFGAVGPAADLYSLGVVALELLAGPDFDALAGVGPDAADPEIGWLRLHGGPDDRLPAATVVAPGLPADLARVIDRLLAKEVTRRYPTAAEAMADLEPVSAPVEEPAAPEPTRQDQGSSVVISPTPDKKKPWNNPYIVYPAVAGLLLLAAGGMQLRKMLRATPPEPVQEVAELSVSVASAPSGAKLTIDGQDQGKTPARVALTPGKHQVKLALAGYSPLEETLVVEKDGDSRTYRLQPRGVRVESTPKGARLTIDGRNCGLTPVRVPLKPGKYELKLALTGYLPLTESLVVATREAGPRTYKLVSLSDLAKQHLLAARDHMDREKWNLALLELKKSIELDETRALAHAWLAQVYDALDNREAKTASAMRAQARAEQVLKANPNDGETFLARGLARQVLRLWDFALADFDKAITLGFEPARAYLARAGLHQARRSVDKGLAGVGEALTREPKLLPALRLRGDLHLSKGLLPQAEADFNSALALDKELASGWTGLGRVCYRKKDLLGAIKHFTEAIRLSPGLRMVVWERAEAYADMGDRYAAGDEVKEDHKEALVWYRKAAGDGHPRGEHSVGSAYWTGKGAHQDDVEAVKWFRKAAEKDYARAQNDLGVAHLSGRGAVQDDSKAVEWFRKAAEQELAQGQRNLGWLYEIGRGVIQDHAQAAKWYRAAAEQQEAFAQGRLGWLAEHGLGTKKDIVEAVKWYQRAVKGGDVESMNHLGRMFKLGTGVGQSDAEAVKWFLAAAKQGLPKAQANLGIMLSAGRGVEKNDVEAAKWFLEAAKAGLAPAQARLGSMYALGRGVTRDDAQAIRWLQLAADQKDPRGQNNLGWMYEQGVGVTRDPAIAAKYYLLAAEQNLGVAQFNLGKLHEQGMGVTRDAAAAAKWYRLAANQKLAAALNALGRLHALGRGVARDDDEAVKLYRQAAEQKFPDAQNNLAWMLAQGRGVERDDAEAVKFFRLAAAQKNPLAQNNLACMLVTGRGVERDDAEAVKLFRLAAEKGVAAAQHNLGWMYESGRGVERDAEEAARWYRKAAASKSVPLHAMRLPRGTDKASKPKRDDM